MVFGLFSLLGYNFSPRFCDLADQRFWPRGDQPSDNVAAVGIIDRAGSDEGASAPAHLPIPEEHVPLHHLEQSVQQGLVAGAPARQASAGRHRPRWLRDRTARVGPHADRERGPGVPT